MTASRAAAILAITFAGTCTTLALVFAESAHVAGVAPRTERRRLRRRPTVSR